MEVPDAIAHVPVEGNHVVQVHQARSLPHAGKNDFGRPLEGGWSAHKTKLEPEKPEQARVGRERRLLSVLGGDRDLPVPSDTFHCREDHRVAEEVRAVVRPRDPVDILDRELDQQAVVRPPPEAAT